MEYNDYFYDCSQDERLIKVEETHTKLEWKKAIKGLINVSGLCRWLDESQDWWLPAENFVEVAPSDEKIHGYPNYDTGRIKGDFRLYMKQNEYEIRGLNHMYVYQTGYDDSYSGFLLFPLKDGRYTKIEFNC